MKLRREAKVLWIEADKVYQIHFDDRDLVLDLEEPSLEILLSVLRDPSSVKLKDIQSLLEFGVIVEGTPIRNFF